MITDIDIESETLDHGNTFTFSFEGEDEKSGKPFHGQVTLPREYIEPLRNELNTILFNGPITQDTFDYKLPTRYFNLVRGMGLFE